MEELTLKNAYISATFGAASGLPRRYGTPDVPVAFEAALPGDLPLLRYCRLAPREYHTVPLAPVRHVAGASTLSFLFEQPCGDAVLRFWLRYRIDDSSLFTTLEEVEEPEGFEMISLAVSRLGRVMGADGTWLAHCANSGSLVSLIDARPGRLPEHSYFDDIMPILPVVMLGQPEAVCVLEVTAYQDGVHLEVAGEGAEKAAWFGTVMKHRVDGSGWCNSNNDDLDKVYGNEDTPNILVGQKPASRLDVIGDWDGNARVDWVDGAKLVHSRMPRYRSNYYENKLVYLANLHHPTLEKPKATFAQMADYIDHVSRLIDGWGQVAIGMGWQVGGMDTGYPAVAPMNDAIGGREGYLELLEKADEMNCRFVLHDNFDDAYRESHEWHESMVARLPDGSLWKSRAWTKDPSYVLGMKKYVEGQGKHRAEFFCKHYRLKDVGHIDVLSWFAVRNDWDPMRPASGIDNLYDGRYQILDDFARQGVDISSEALRYPMVGRMTMNVVENDFFGDCPFGGLRIPLVSIVYRNAAIYGGDTDWLATSRPQRHLHNIHKVLWFPWDQPNEEQFLLLGDIFYLQYLPWFLLHRLEVLDYRREGNVETLLLEQDSKVVANIPADRCELYHKGERIATNDSVFCRADPLRIAFYSLNAETLSCLLPMDWDATKLSAAALSVEGRTPHPIWVKDGRITVEVAPRLPVMVYRSKEDIL